MNVPFFRPSLGEPDISAVLDCLRSGWLTSGPAAKRFETEFALAVGGKHAVALNSCTAALHLAVEALGLTRGDAVLVPTMTFASTAEIVRYQGALPVLVDCDPVSFHLDLADAKCKLDQLSRGTLPAARGQLYRPVGIIPVHVGGWMMDISAIQAFAQVHGLWVVEDAAHSFPAAWRPTAESSWQRCGEATARVSCYSFYANKTITTGEGGMAVTDEPELADRIRMMSLHGLSRDAWNRYSGGSWDYRIVAPGYKYNMTDVAAALGTAQLARAEAMRMTRESLAMEYLRQLSDLPALELPPVPANRVHSWHLFPVRLELARLRIDRNAFIDQLKARGVGCSVHWRPLHLHPYYADEFGWTPEELPAATAVWQRLVTLPLFPDLQPAEQAHVVRTVREICREQAR